MDPSATIREFLRTTKIDRDRQSELADAYQQWLDKGGFLPRIRHRNDPKGLSYAVTGLYARGNLTYFLCAGNPRPLLGAEYEIVP